jgi:hypothetical protein
VEQALDLDEIGLEVAGPLGTVGEAGLKVRELLGRIRDELDLDDEGRAALEAVQSQADLGRSDSPIIHGGLAEVRAFAAGVGASTVGRLIVNYLAGAPPF